jgi:hypothetical protein
MLQFSEQRNIFLRFRIWTVFFKKKLVQQFSELQIILQIKSWKFKLLLTKIGNLFSKLKWIEYKFFYFSLNSTNRTWQSNLLEIQVLTFEQLCKNPTLTNKFVDFEKLSHFESEKDSDGWNENFSSYNHGSLFRTLMFTYCTTFLERSSKWNYSHCTYFLFFLNANSFIR